MLEGFDAEQVDTIALSFVRSAEDVLMLRDLLKSIKQAHVRIMSKIETQKAVNEIDSIAAVSDSLMVARGDLWCELSNSWSLPRITCDIIRAGLIRGIPVITATQVASSMQTQSLPTRAEVDEIYFLLTQGSDCIMGSEEFTIGLYPRETALAFRTIGEEVFKEQYTKNKIILRAQTISARDLSKLSHFGDPKPLALLQSTSSNHEQRMAAIHWAEHSDRVACMVVISDRGTAARALYREKPQKPIVVITNNHNTARYLQLFQVIVVYMNYTVEMNSNPRNLASMALKELLAKKPAVLVDSKNNSTSSTALLISNEKVNLEGNSLECFKVEEIPFLY